MIAHFIYFFLPDDKRNDEYEETRGAADADPLPSRPPPMPLSPPELCHDFEIIAAKKRAPSPLHSRSYFIFSLLLIFRLLPFTTELRRQRGGERVNVRPLRMPTLD